MTTEEIGATTPDATLDRPQHRTPTWWGVLVGLLAAATGLAFGELVAGFSRSLRSPVVSVGDRVIDQVPRGLKIWAIRTFGTSDKVVLIWSILIVIGIAASLVGVATVRGRRMVGLVGATVFGVLGALAAGVGRGTTLVGVFPSLVAAAVAAIVLMIGHRLAFPHPQAANVVPVIGNEPTNRRSFLIAGAGLALTGIAVGTAGRSLQGRFNTALQRVGVQAPTAKEPLPAPPTDPALHRGRTVRADHPDQRLLSHRYGAELSFHLVGVLETQRQRHGRQRTHLHLR